MNQLPIYREVKNEAPHNIPEHVFDVVVDRLLLVLDEMERAEREREAEDPERWDGME